MSLHLLGEPSSGEHMKQLSGLDASFLYLETGSSFGHVNSLSVFERPDDPAFNPYDTYRKQIESRLGMLEPFRRRLVEVPFGLDHPYWILDPDFDIDFHLRHIAIPSPGDPQQIGEQISRIIGRPMDRSRPLWEIYVLEGFESGDFGVLTKFHHATIDGASGSQFASMLLDAEPNETDLDAPTPSWPGERVPSDLELLNRTAVQLGLRPGKVIRLQVQLLRELGALTRNQGFDMMADRLAKGLPGPLGAGVRQVIKRTSGPRPEDVDKPPSLPSLQAPSTPFNQSITPHRRFAFKSVPLDDIKTLKNAMGCTLNDVVMAICAGALRRYLEDHDALPDEPLIAGIPVSIRTGDEEDPWTNRVSSIFCELPTHETEPLDRVKSVNTSMVAAKEQFDLVPAELLVEFSDLIPAGLASRAARLASRMRMGDRINMPVNLIISNVPGPRSSLYMGSARLKHYYPVSTVVEGQGLNITVQSYCDVLDFGLVACRELVPDLWTLLDYCVDEIEVLFEAAGVVRSADGELVVAAPVAAKPASGKKAAAKKTAKKKAAKKG